MKKISAYECADGVIFTDEKNAKDHDDYLLGQKLAGLLRLCAHDLTHNQEFKMCLSALSKRDELKTATLSIIRLLNYVRNTY